MSFVQEHMQQRQLQSEGLETLLGYWKEQLDGALTVLELPADRPRPSVRTLQGATCSFELPMPLLRQLEALGGEAEDALFVALLAAFQVLLHRYTGQEDILVGTILAGRDRVEVEGLIGLFTNLLVCRGDLSGDPTFRELLEQVRETTLGALAHRDLPFEILLQELGLDQDLSREPLCQAAFALYKAPMQAIDSPGLTLSLLQVQPRMTKFDLALYLEDTGDGLKGVVEYSTDLFDAATIKRMVGHLQVLLEGVVTDPDRRLSGLVLLTDVERHRLLVEWNDTRVEYPRDKCIHQLFEEQAAQTPDAVAMVFQDQHLTYQELNWRANQLAHYLRGLGVGPEVLVGICVERSPEMIVGLMGILKAGGAYVPLDPAYPQERLTLMLEDSQTTVLLTQQRLVERMPDHQAQVVCLDTDWEEISQLSQTTPPPLATSDNLIYVLYTSGSTGRPKGVAIEHRNAVALIAWATGVFGKEQLAGTLASTSICFDLSIFELFMPLGCGGMVVLAQTALNLPTLPAADAVTLVNTVPSAMKELLRMERIPSSVRTVNLAGEPLQTQLVEQIYQREGIEQVFDLYGPTEDTTYTTYAFRNAEGPATIGQPIDNTQVYLLDGYLNPVPVGVPGELYIGGAGLARGYLGRPGLTAERFIPNPFSDEQGVRLYRTGDLARYLPDGNIEFLGRIDHQVKVRGFRIELGEIEAVLGQHPTVRETVVLAWADDPTTVSGTGKRLVAYVVPQDGQEPKIGELGDFLREKLPEYMVPSMFVTLEALPLTPNGKVNRRALPAPDQVRPELEKAFVAPRTPVEEILADIWSRVLGLERVGIQDGFLELGGHSLLGTQIISRVRDAFQVELALGALFKAPTVAELAEHIEIARQGEQQSLSIPPIVPISREGELPLSFAQQRLWFLDQWAPGNPVYNVPTTYCLVGELDIATLEWSLDEIIRRHEALRTIFAAEEGRPRQIIAPTFDFSLPVVDLCELAETEREAEAHRLTIAEARWPFDLATGPLIRALLLRLGEERHTLSLTMHHIVSDGWSMWVFATELAALYQAFIFGEPASLPGLAIQYADFVMWQREWLQGEVLETQLAYWKQQLEGIPDVLNLPTDRPRPPAQTYRGATRVFELSQSLVKGLEALSQQEGCTLFMTLLAALEALLYRYTGQVDIVVGSPIANRHWSQVEESIGFFVNTLAIRTDLSGDPGFCELLRQVRGVALEAYAHQDLPFEKLVEELQPERSLSYSPIFQVMFVLQNTPMPVLELPHLTVTSSEIANGTAKFDLDLAMWNTGPGLEGVIEYNTDLFDASTIDRLVGHFQTLLESVVANPHTCLSDLDILTEVERQQLLVEWSRTDTHDPQAMCIHELFEAQVECTPNKEAVIFDGQSLTYQELNCQANQLAHYLRRLGVGPETLVGICMERSLELMIGLLAILKAGGAYVPLDPIYPAERLGTILKDIRSPIIVTESRSRSSISDLESLVSKIVCLDTDWEEDIARESEENPFNETTSQNLAYVIYTSGSTGKPKGVTVQHCSLVDYTQTASTEYALGSGDHVLQFASISFDASAEEIYPTLTRGATLVLRTESMIDTVASFLSKCHNWGITVLNLPTAYWHVLASELGRGELAFPSTVRLMIIGGERAAPERLGTWQQQVDRQIRLVNTYGPTEATIVTTMCELPGEVEAGAVLHEVPIGRAVRNVQTFVLDQYLHPVPVGVPGELYIGGSGLARGYLDRPGLTAERFIPTPFPHPARKDGARLYRTGDLVRYRADGNLEFLGRTDRQVKIRGFRIELGEIESVLSQHPAMQEAVVLARDAEHTPGSKRMVAYVVPQAEQKVMVRDLRSFMKEKLPDYMIPSTFVTLDALPLMPNGKVDRSALTAPGQAQSELEATFVAPRTPTEEVVAGIWVHVLGIEQVGVTDNFFDLGGHSLLATQIVSRVREAYQVELPLRRLFESPSIAALAADINQMRRAEQGFQIPPLVPVSRDERLPLSFAQQRLWFLDQWEPDSPFYNIPVALCFSGRLNVAMLEQSLNEILRRHQILRTTFMVADEEPVQVIVPSLAIKVPVVDLEQFPEPQRETQVQRLAAQEARHTFDLTVGPLVRATLLRLNAHEHVLLLNMHHIVSDEWAIGILLREWQILYRAFCAGDPSPLPDLDIQYADFAVWQREWLQGEVLETQLAYWKEHLGGELPILELPTNRPRPAVQTLCGTVRSFALPESLSRALKALGRQEGATLFMTLLTAFKVLLHRYTDQTDLTVGTPVAGRNWSKIEELIGFFVNTLVMRTDLSGNPTFRELLSQVREVALGAFTHQDVPFEVLVEELQPERDLSHTPLFQVMFALQNTPMETPDLPDLTMNLLEADSGTAKFDLSLFLQNTGQGLEGAIEYNTDLFDASTMDRLVGHFKTLLEGIVTDPNQRILDLPLLTETERHRLLVGWNDTSTEYPKGACIYELFESQKEQTPDAVAVVFSSAGSSQSPEYGEDQHLTYQELDRRAKQLAHHLQGLDVGPEILVGICVERSLEMMVGLMGILKAGGAYVPLDPAYPQERLSLMLKDSQAAVLLTQQELVEGMSEHKAQVVCLDTDWETIAQQSQEHPPSGATADNLAYMIYTSGSTGRPKGVQVPQRAVVNFLESMRQQPGLTEQDILLSVTTLSFDIAVLELFLPLAVGARVVLISRAMAADGIRLAKVLAASRATLMQATPATWRLLLESGWQDDDSVRILCGGEALPSVLADELAGQGAALWNMYGPTETTVWSSIYEVRTAGVPVTIGRPIANTEMYILDALLTPVPIGVPGKLYIGGDGLARGYFDRPELTAQAFVPNPFSDEEKKTGARLYKTGDLARYLPDGNIEFLGRADHQVKVRGFRIELGEIEAILSQHPVVRETVVVALKDGPDDTRLVAYVVPNQGQAPSISELRSVLRSQLPDYMVPSVFMMLEEMPLTPNGKVNRRALPAPDTKRPTLDSDFVVPRTPVEKILAGIWCKILGIDRVGIHDDFFDLGGHSLLATRLALRLRKAFQIELPLRYVFETPTVAGLSKSIETVRWAAQDLCSSLAVEGNDREEGNL